MGLGLGMGAVKPYLHFHGEQRAGKVLTAPRALKMITLKTAVLRWRPMQYTTQGHRNGIHLTP